MSDGEAMRVVGTMSGTSLDGVDAAEIVTDGESILSFGRSTYRAYSNEERAALRAALGLWSGPEVARAAAMVEAVHAELLESFDDAELVGFHGQTLAHEPGGRGTLQAGDGAALARRLGRPVAWDFRSADVAAGGQGAPLAPFFHFACARWMGAGAPVAFLNLGGVGNLTLADPTCAGPEAPGACLAFDTGPANAPIDDLMQARAGLPRDEGGAVAVSGQVHEALLRDVLEDSYFTAPAPKSLDRGAFSERLVPILALPLADAAATLTALAAAAVALGLTQWSVQPERILATGGGRHNPVLMRMLAERCRRPVNAVEEVGLDGDMLEAQAFAHLAVRVRRRLPLSAPGTTGVPAPTGGGRISLPG